KYHTHTPEIIKLADHIGRSPSAVAMKLSNFASLDPYHQARGITGLKNRSQADEDIWNEFSTHWDELAVESEIAYAQLLGVEILYSASSSHIPETEEIIFTRETETRQEQKIRLGQQFFRNLIMTSYSSQCCVCKMPIPELLIASHIVPWRDDKSLRVNPHNGLCLCALHDKGFDRGFFTLDEEYRVILGQIVRNYLPNPSVYNEFNIYEGQRISLPDKFIPKQEFLEIHRDKYFLK
ncbi:MAG: HNH endonuclease, partial [Phototrophicaceae bacterium]